MPIDLIELKEDFTNEKFDFTEWQNVLNNLEGTSAFEMFYYGVLITKQLEIYEQHKKDTRRSYNVAVENYNTMLEISENIKEALSPEDNFKGEGDYTEDRKEFVGKSTVEELAKKINESDE